MWGMYHALERTDYAFKFLVENPPKESGHLHDLFIGGMLIF